jgi:hypothetical protein
MDALPFRDMDRGMPRFLEYTRRIEILHIRKCWPSQEVDGSLLVALQRLDGDLGRFFPRLRTLKLRTRDLWLPGFGDAVTAFLTPRITRLELSRSNSEKLPEGLDLDRLATTTTGLHEFEFAYIEYREEEETYKDWARLLNIVTCATNQLTSFSAPHFSPSPRAIAHLSLQSHLKHMSIHGESGYDYDIDEVLKSVSGGFCQLETLELDDATRDTTFALSVLRNLELPRLRKCVVKIVLWSNSLSIDRNGISAAVEALEMHSTLTSVAVTLTRGDYCEKVSEDLIIQAFDSLRRLRHLEHVLLDIYLPTTFSEEHLILFATSWPRLELWTIEADKVKQLQAISLRGMMQILSSCPNVEELPIRLDCHDCHELQLVRDVVSHNHLPLNLPLPISLFPFPSATRPNHPFGPALGVQIREPCNISPLAQLLAHLVPNIRVILGGLPVMDYGTQPRFNNEQDKKAHKRRLDLWTVQHRKEVKWAGAMERRIAYLHDQNSGK